MKKRNGFTLVEILIVVVILGILAAIVIPQFSNASEEAKTVESGERPADNPFADSALQDSAQRCSSHSRRLVI